MYVGHFALCVTDTCEAQSLAGVALRCLCELLLALPHFNFHNNILTVLVPRMNSKALSGEVRYAIAPFFIMA